MTSHCHHLLFAQPGALQGPGERDHGRVDGFVGEPERTVMMGEREFRAAQGAPEQLRVVSTSTFAEFMISPLTEAFSKRFPGSPFDFGDFTFVFD